VFKNRVRKFVPDHENLGTQEMVTMLPVAVEAHGKTTLTLCTDTSWFDVGKLVLRVRTSAELKPAFASFVLHKIQPSFKTCVVQYFESQVS
jgi:hypothetical protein